MLLAVEGEATMAIRSRVVSVAIVDDHPVMRQGLAAVIGSGGKFRVVAEGASAEDAVRIAAELQPDLILLDLQMPGGGLDALSQIVATSPEVKCIMFTASESVDFAIEAMRRGAKGYVLKGISAVDLRATLWTVYNNGSYILPSFASKVFSAAIPAAPSPMRDNELSQREQQVLQEVAKGSSNKQVALKLGISEKTVKHYMTTTMSKLGVANRVAAVMRFQRGNP